MNLKRFLVFSAALVFSFGLLIGPASAKSVTVKKGDSLWLIAKNNGTTVANLKKLNNLSSDALQPGQVLKVAAQVTAAKTSKEVNRTTPQKKVASRSGEAKDRAEEVIAYAKRFIGTDYKFGGMSPKGFDCSGFVKYVFANSGVNLSRSSKEQYSDGTKIQKSDLLPGDLVFFSTRGLTIGHVGIYMGNNNFIHSSSSSSGGVRIDSLGSTYYSSNYYGANRVLK